jgi:hypothetical protein
MLRAEALRSLARFMRQEWEPADDFDLYHRLLAVGDIDRLDDELCIYRWHDANASHALADRMQAAAGGVLARAYRPWLGEAAEAAAGLVVRHLSERRPAPDAATLAALGRVLARVLAGFFEATAPDRASRALIEAHAARAWWLASRAAVRAGSPTAMLHWHRATFSRAFHPAVADAAASGARPALRGSGAGRPDARLMFGYEGLSRPYHRPLRASCP